MEIWISTYEANIINTYRSKNWLYRDGKVYMSKRRERKLHTDLLRSTLFREMKNVYACYVT
jgi:hypothetical protein